jgi:transcriptional regulator GlxA family with amidase domain
MRWHHHTSHGIGVPRQETDAKCLGGRDATRCCSASWISLLSPPHSARHDRTLRGPGANAEHEGSCPLGGHSPCIHGAAGLLTGYRATCHWMYLPLLQLLGVIPTAERVVVDRNRITAAGVSAGIDCALQLVSLLRGQEAAQVIQLQMEYDPQPPFDCGSPRKAPDWLVNKLMESAKTTIAARRAVVNRIALRHSG